MLWLKIRNLACSSSCSYAGLSFGNNCVIVCEALYCFWIERTCLLCFSERTREAQQSLRRDQLSRSRIGRERSLRVIFDSLRMRSAWFDRFVEEPALDVRREKFMSNTSYRGRVIPRWLRCNVLWPFIRMLLNSSLLLLLFYYFT